MRDWSDVIAKHPELVKLLTLILVLGGIWYVSKWATRAANRHIAAPASRFVARKGIAFAAYLATALVTLSIFSDRLSSLTVALGVAGAGIAFALQEVITSVAGWLAISFGDFYKTGDRIQLGGIVGDVIDVGLLRTTLMEAGQWVKGDLYTGRIVRIANSFVFKEPVFNYSADFPFLWDEITVPIKYGCSHHRARQMLERVASEVVGDYARQAQTAWDAVVRKYLIEAARVEPMVSLVANDNWMEFTLRYVVDHRRRRATKDRLFTRILDEVEASGGALVIASSTLQLVSTNP